MTDTLAQLRNGQLAGSTRLDLRRCGLTEFPKEIFGLAETLEFLDLTGNQFKSLPDDFALLQKLRIFFCSENEFEHLPAVLGACPHLSMVGFKANRIETVDPAAFSESLRWLILTDNRIRELPPTLGRCGRLQKLMLSGNRLSTLPETMAACGNLELLRLAANEFAALPPWLLELPRLSWLAFAGNPCSARNIAPGEQEELLRVPWGDLHVREKLGEGASGTIYRASWRVDGNGESEPVAVKLFKGAVTSDGLPACEMEACLVAGMHEHLIPLRGRVVEHPEGVEGLVMSLIDPAYATLAGPPSFESCTRDVYTEGLRLASGVVLAMALGVASAAQHLHGRGMLHGDLYAHNVLWHADGHCLLGDFGGATFYNGGDAVLARALQGIEVRALGCLLEELVMRGDWVTEAEKGMEAQLWELQRRCVADEVSGRPGFGEMAGALRDLSQSCAARAAGE